MTLEKIGLIVFKDHASLILDRILDFSVVPVGESIYSLDEDETKVFYDRIILHKKLNMPSQARIDEEVAEYKAELTVIENARLAEVARVKDIEDRFGVIQDLHGVFAKAGLLISNPLVELKRIIKENDQARLSLLESKNTEFIADNVKLKAKAVRKGSGKKARNACEEALDLIAGYNLEKNFTAAEITQMESDFGPVVGMLRAFRPTSAKVLIEAIVPDGTILTEEFKSEVLEELVGF